MGIDRSYIRVKSMVILLSPDRSRHIVSRLDRTRENPGGFDRLIGGSVELGERAADAAAREVKEELLVDVENLRLLDVVENIFTFDGEQGHEVVFVYTGEVPEDTVPSEGAMFAEADGSPMQVVWRPVRGDQTMPLYPGGSQELVEGAVDAP